MKIVQVITDFHSDHKNQGLFKTEYIKWSQWSQGEYVHGSVYEGSIEFSNQVIWENTWPYIVQYTYKTISQMSDQVCTQDYETHTQCAMAI